MKVSGIRILGLLLLTLSGCVYNSQSDWSAAAQHQFAQVEFIRPYQLSRQDVSYTPLGEVSASSCQATASEPLPSEAEALLRLKLAAAAVGANRIILRQCRLVATAACEASWVCSGDAHQQQPLR